MYCPKCKEMQDKPSVREIFKGSYECVHCGYDRGIEDHEKDMAFDMLMDRIEAIEAKLGIKSDVWSYYVDDYY